jgi:hypothetical protein
MGTPMPQDESDRTPFRAALLIAAATYFLSTTWLPQQKPAVAQVVSIAKEVNLLAPDEGGQAILVPHDGWLAPVTGKGDQGAGVSIGEEAVYAFRDEKPATFSKFSLLITAANDINIREFELLVADDWKGEFRSLGKFTTIDARVVQHPYQEFTFPETNARYMKIKILSNWGHCCDAVVLPPLQLIGHVSG